MKKILSLVLFLAVAFAGLKALALNDDNGAAFRKGGGQLTNSSTITFGSFPMATSCLSGTFLADCNISAGDVVTIPTTAVFGNGYNEVTKTATAGDQNVIGISLETITYGNSVRVAYGAGTVVAKSNVNGVIGKLYCTSATAGQLTRTSSITEVTATNLSRTPSVLMCIQNKTLSAAGDTIEGILVR